MAADIHVDDIGTILEATIKDENGTVVDLSTTTLRQMKLERPDKTVVAKVAVLSGDGTNGKLLYTTVVGDLNQAGQWQAQPYVEFANGTKWHATKFTFKVQSILT